MKFNPEYLKPLYVDYHDRERYLKLAAENERKVVRWRAATGSMIRPLPFEHECFMCPDRWLEEGEEPEFSKVLNGFDAEGRILIARQVFRLNSAKEDLAETQYLHEEGKIISISPMVYGGPEKFKVEEVAQFTYEAGRLVEYQKFGFGHAFMETFHWSGERLERSILQSADHTEFFYPNSTVPEWSDWSGSQPIKRQQITYEYNAQGQLARTWRCLLDDNCEPDPAYKPWSEYVLVEKGQTIESLSAEIETLLIEGIPAAVKAAHFPANAYCLLLCYCGEDWAAGWPPFLVIGGEAERNRILQAGQDVAYYLWSPDEMREKPGNRELALNDPALIDKSYQHMRLLSAANNYAPVLEILQRVARKLNQFSWAGILPTTADFIVAFADNTGGRPVRDDIKASVPEAQFADLTARGLL